MTENAIHSYLEKGWSYIQTSTTHEFFAPRGSKKIIYSKRFPMLRLGIYPEEENVKTSMECYQKSLS